MSGGRSGVPFGANINGGGGIEFMLFGNMFPFVLFVFDCCCCWLLFCEFWFRCCC